MDIRLAASLVLSCLAVPAFAAKPALPATPIQTSQPAEIIFTQQELAVEVPDTANAVGMQFGLIGALVGSAISNAQVKNAEERVGELRNVLLDYPFNARVEAALREKLAASGTLGDQGIKVLHATWDADSATLAGTTEDALVLVPRYAILSNFEQLSVSLSLSHVQRTAKPGKKPRQKSLFARTYAFHFPLSNAAASDPEQDAARWVAFGRQPLEALLDAGIDQVTDMLVYDLSAEARAEAEQPIRGLGGSVGGQQFDGRMVREGDRWLWLRTGPGALRALVGQYPVDETVIAALPQPATPIVAVSTMEGAEAPSPQAEADLPVETGPADTAGVAAGVPTTTEDTVAPAEADEAQPPLAGTTMETPA